MNRQSRVGGKLCSQYRVIGLLKLSVVALTVIAISGSGCDTVQLNNLAPAGPGGAEGQLRFGESDLATAAQGAGARSTVVRDIEEADIVKVVDGKLYALNQAKGLLIVDVSNPDDPSLLGNLDLRGRGVEMYVVGARVFVLLSADYYHFNYGGGVAISGGVVDGDSNAQRIQPDGTRPPEPDFEGSQLAIVDVGDPTEPAMLGKIDLAGFATQSRRVGDVIYVAGTNYGCYRGYWVEGDEANTGFVASVNVADPDNIIPVERETFDGDSLAMHVSQTAIFVTGYGYDTENDQVVTNVRYVDISDAAGAIALRGGVDVPGFIRNRFQMDDYEGVFRIVTQSRGFGFRTVKVFTYDLTDPDNIVALGEAEIMQGESLEAVRFDGPRGYVVTFLRVDPLFVLDLSDPANPIVAGELEVPGFSTHIEPRGDRLIAVGIDDTDGRRPAVAYYDVEDPANPTQLGRVILGPPGSFTESEAVWDEKAFKIVDALGLIAIPFRYVDYSDWVPLPGVAGAEANAQAILPDEGPDCLNAVQLVDFSDTTLTQRGWFEHRGRVERVGMVGDRVFALSQLAFQTVDITDRDEPTAVGRVDFFTQDEFPYYLDDCYVYFPDVIGIGGPSQPELPILFQIFLNGEMCGTGTVAAGVGVMLCFVGMRGFRRRRR